MAEQRERVIGAGTALGAGVLLLLAPFSINAQVEPETPRSPRNANYTIDVRLDPELKMLEGRELLVWRNIQETPATELRFHLYWNGWRNSQSTWMREDRFRGRSDRGKEIGEEDWGWCRVLAMRQLAIGEEPGADLTPGLHYASPDDGNSNDRTVLVAPLAAPVEPGESIEVELTWQAKIPRTFARTGFRGDYFFLAHWFPKLAVFEGGGWNAHQYHAGTEYYSDYGFYDVSMTVPAEFVLGATGREVGRRENPDGTITYRHVQEDVHAFTWTLSPDYQVLEERFEEPGLPPIDMRLLIQPEHLNQAQRHFEAARAAFRLYGTWYGPYPYGHVTIVDPAYGSGAGGMEYPTLFTAGTRLFNPFGGGSPEGVTIHEAGHQFWYGIVGNNEFEHAWLDEGLNTFSTARVHHEAYGARLPVKRYFMPPGIRGERRRRAFFPVLLEGFRYARPVYGHRLERYRPDAESDRQDTATYLYHPKTGASLSYSKTALWLATLERYLGWEKLQPGMALFFDRWKFGHPIPEDFFSAVSEAAGEDLGWFFDQVYRSSEAFDYALDAVASEPAEVQGLVEAESEMVFRGPTTEDTKEEGETVYRSEVVARRLRGGVFPVQVLMAFEDGSEVRRPWDGKSRWRLFVEERPSKLEYAMVDPDHVLLLDLDRTNNSRLLEPAARFPAMKWASRWLIWLEDYLATWSFFL